jgi:ABC-type multidrug transport system fused ATPase/permease subunit
LEEEIDEPVEIKQNNKARQVNGDFNGDVFWNKVSFSYSDEKVIDEITMLFKKGQITALVGSSGCGKSTIVNLLYRLWDADSGKIMIGDYDIRDYNLKSLRKNISIVTQDILLFDDSIKNNLILGNKEIDIDEIIKICKMVEIYEFIKQLPDGLDTIIGERGVKLSGGQRQRIAIARAIFCPSKIIIMDEATSALDNISQKSILDNIRMYLNNKVTIVIAHRLITIQDADKIYVIEGGKVIEEGTHKELLSNKNIYFKLLKGQSNY